MKVRKLFKIFIYFLVLWFLVHTIYIMIDGLRDDGLSADYAVVLGTTVHEDGTVSRRLKNRLDCANQLYRAGRVQRIIVSGGLGKEGHYEGDKMKEYLILQGIPEALIIVDNHGNNTRQTVENVLGMQHSLQFGSLLVVSQFFHITRTKMLFRKAGFNAVSNAKPYFEFRDMLSVFREFVVFYMQCL